MTKYSLRAEDRTFMFKKENIAFWVDAAWKSDCYWF